MRFWLAGLVGILVTGGLVAVGAVDGEAAEGEAEEATAGPSDCERYGEMTDRIVEARFPEPKPGPLSNIMADDSGYTGVLVHWSVPMPKMYWWCDGEQLSVRVRGPWMLAASDMPSALENLLQDLRDRGLDAQEDAVGIVLEGILVDGSARFDPASEQEPALPDWLTDYNLHAHIIGVFYSPPDRHPRLVGSFESDALMDSLSPGVRASYEGVLLERVEAEHAAYAERRLRWLKEDRAARK
jgi:hypothetical protein